MKLFWLGTLVGALLLIFLVCTAFTVLTVIRRHEERKSDYAQALDDFAEILGGSFDKIVHVMGDKVTSSVKSSFDSIFGDMDKTISLSDEEAAQLMMHSRPEPVDTLTITDDLREEFKDVGISL
jgi:hypothetical protein